MKDFMTPNQLGEYIGRSGFTIRKWIKDGKLQTIKIEGKHLIPTLEVQKLLNTSRR